MKFSQIIKKMYNANNSDFWLSIIRIVFGIFWILSGLGKVMNPDYVLSFPQTIESFMSKNPNKWYIPFLQNFVLPNSSWLAYLISYGELITGLALVFGLLINFFLAYAVFMNINFYFAAGWLSISTAMLNFLMIAIQIILILSLGSKTLSLDYLIKLSKMRKSYVKGKLKLFNLFF
ncbi:MAG: DoxX family protein [Candidatus Aenigmatarchaeota archaeon]